jgi:Mrp family chromosome partitioning ATPase
MRAIVRLCIDKMDTPICSKQARRRFLPRRSRRGLRAAIMVKNMKVNSNHARWQSLLVRFRFLLRWGWFVLLSMALVTICSSFIPNSVSGDGYQATLQVQVQLPTGYSIGDYNTTTAFFSALFTSPSSLTLALPRHKDLQLSDLQGLVIAKPVLDSSIVQLSALGSTPQDATQLVMDVYQAALSNLNGRHTEVVNALKGILTKELQQVQNEVQQSSAELQSLVLAHRETTSQYKQVESLYHEQQKRVDAINAILIQLNRSGSGTNNLLTLQKSTPDITTQPGAASTQAQRVALSPLVGFIMGLGGALLASGFSNRVPLRGKKREEILPQVRAIIRAKPRMRNKRLLMLKQASSECLPLLQHLRYQASEYGTQLRVISVTSSKGQEGKTTIAAMLAIASAQNGQRTFLIDANPQRPVLHTWFGLPNTRGTLDYIRALASGVSDGSSPTSATFVSNLEVAPIGNRSQKGTSPVLEESLRIDGLRPLIESLRGQADLIVVDSPSLLSDSGTANLVMLSDMTLLVVDAQKSLSTRVLEAKKLLSTVEAPCAVVLNRALADSVE